MKFSCGNFLNSTNNRLESINRKLKQVIDRNSSLEDFLFHFCILTALRTERDHKAAVMFQKVRVCPFPKDSAEYSYSQLLTSYAFTFVNKQLKLIDKVKNFDEAEEGYVCQTSEGSRNVNLSDCSCAFRTSMLLPCCHMFALRKGLCNHFIMLSCVIRDGLVTIIGLHSDYSAIHHHSLLL